MKSLRIHCFQQVAVEGLGCIADWIYKDGHTLSYTKFYEKPVLPLLDDFDCLIVMGGPMSVYDEEKNPWLADEKRLIKGAIEAGKKVLGICLGSQFIAAALGAEVYPGKNTEIGWFPLQLTGSGLTSVLRDIGGEYVFHWHGDTFDIPQGATLLAQSEATPHQAFMYGDNVLALQFHLEVTEESIDAMVSTFASHLVADDYIQDATHILSQKNYVIRNNRLMYDILDEFMLG